nr:hypothetical protein [Campylobacter jejuni]
MKKEVKSKLQIIFTKMKKIQVKVKKLIFIMMMKVLKIDLALCLKENII